MVLRRTIALRRAQPYTIMVLCAALMPGVRATARAQAAKPMVWNVLEAGAVADGETDCTAAFQKALDVASEAGGGIVHVPAGRYAIRGNLKVPANVTLQGTYRMPPTIGRPMASEIGGSVLLAFAGRGSVDGEPFIRLAGNCSAVEGLVILYPEWKQSDVPPVPYPPCIASQHTENVAVQNCCLVNPYEGISFVLAHRHLIRNVTGYPIKRGIYVDECYDIGHIENVHFWPFGVAYKPDDPYCYWINTRGVAFELARTDWHYVSNTFCFGYGIGYKFSESRAGSTNGNFLGLGADSCQRAVVVEQAQDPGLLITNGEFVGRWGSTDAVCVEVGPKVVGKVSLVNCSFWGPIDRCIWMRSSTGVLSASACHFVHWNNGGRNSPAVDLEAGSSIVQGCTFGNQGVHVRVGAKAQSAIIMGNQSEEGIIVRNFAGARSQIVGNNEEGGVQWTPEARVHYRLSLGKRGDARWVEGVYGRESLKAASGEISFRWTTGLARLTLPVRSGRAYTVTLVAQVPAAALAPDAGVYVGNKRVVAFTESGLVTLSGRLEPPNGDTVTLTIRCKPWVPAELDSRSGDRRKLGVQLRSITMRATRGAGTRVFDANTGTYLAERAQRQ